MRFKQLINFDISVIVHGSFAPEKIEEIFARTQGSGNKVLFFLGGEGGV